jgi:hypothetical protein
VIVSHNYYYARPGNAAAVLRQRLSASDVRVRIGLPRGHVLRRIAGAEDLPDVIWELEFGDLAAHHADMAVRAASPEFEAIRQGMRRLYRRFERPLYQPCGADSAVPRLRKTSQHIVFINIYCKQQNKSSTRDLLLQRLSGTDRLLQLVAAQGDVPHFIWETAGETAVEAVRLASTADLSAPAQSSTWQVQD